MKNRRLVLVIFFLGLFLWVCGIPQGGIATTTNKTEQETIEEVKALIAKHDQGLNDKNLESLMSTFSSDPNTVVLGTGAGERYAGPEAIKQAYAEIFKDYDAGTLKRSTEYVSGRVDPSNSMTWFAATISYEDSLKNVKRNYLINVSAAAVKENGTWRLNMLHMSNAGSALPPATEK